MDHGAKGVEWPSTESGVAGITEGGILGFGFTAMNFFLNIGRMLLNTFKNFLYNFTVETGKLALQAAKDVFVELHALPKPARYVPTGTHIFKICMGTLRVPT